MKNKMLSVVYIIAYYFGIFKLFYILTKKQQRVITYHNVISDDIFDNSLLHLGVSCSESAFIQQLNIINSRFKIATEIGISGTCIITFDDGYRNNIDIAAPHLNAKKVSGLFFIPASYFDNNQLLWIDKLLMWVSYVPVGSYFILGKKVDITSNSHSRRLLWERIYQEVFSNYARLELLITELNDIYQFNKLKSIINSKMYNLRFEGMSIHELDKLKDMGHKIGCHSFKHDILSLLTEEQLEHDFSTCALYAKKYNTNFYSYPFGGKNEVSPSVINKCRKYVYSAAFLNYEAKNPDIYTLGRMSLDDLKNKYFIEARLCGFETYLKKLITIFSELKSIILKSQLKGSYDAKR